MTRPVEWTVDADGNLLQSTFTDQKFTISFSRKANLGNYESAEVFISTQVLVPSDADADEKASAIRDGFVMVRASAYEQLGIKFAVDEASIVQERLERTFGPVEVVTGAEAKPYNAPQAPTAPRSDTAPPKSKKALWEELASNPERWFDNRETKKSPNGPDFKRKQTGEGLWLTYKGQSSVPAGVTVPDPSAFR